MSKAYEVSDSLGDSGGRIMYAEKNVVARRNGAGELGCGFGDVSCRRAPWADEFFPNGPTPQQCIELGGWYYECSCGCGRRIDSDDGYGISADDTEENPVEPVYVGGGVYWNQRCKDGEEQRQRERAEAKARDQAEAEAAVLEKFPFATDIKTYRCHGTVDGKTYSHDVLGASFAFPGGKRHAHWVIGAKSIDVAQIDIDAWNDARLEAAQ